MYEKCTKNCTRTGPNAKNCPLSKAVRRRGSSTVVVLALVEARAGSARPTKRTKKRHSVEEEERTQTEPEGMVCVDNQV